MVLQESNIFFYLLEKGITTYDDLIHGNFSVSNISNRNSNFIVKCGSKQIFLKQPKDIVFDRIDSLKKESHYYKIFRENHFFRNFIPAYDFYDECNVVLAVKFLTGFQDLFNYYYNSSNFHSKIGQYLGTLLSAFHSTFTIYTFTTNDFTIKKIPWIFYINQTNGPYTPRNKLEKEIIEIIASYTAFVNLIDLTRAKWEESCLIHGDIKFKNFLINDAEPFKAIKLIDWETTTFGDPAWDVAGIIQAYLSYWVSFKNHEKKEVSLTDIQHTLYCLIKEYTKTFQEAHINEFVLKSISFAGVRLIQTALETTPGLSKLNFSTISFLQLGFNLLNDPISAKAEFLLM